MLYSMLQNNQDYWNSHEPAICAPRLLEVDGKAAPRQSRGCSSSWRGANFELVPQGEPGQMGQACGGRCLLLVLAALGPCCAGGQLRKGEATSGAAEMERRTYNHLPAEELFGTDESNTESDIDGGERTAANASEVLVRMGPFAEPYTFVAACARGWLDMPGEAAQRHSTTKLYCTSLRENSTSRARCLAPAFNEGGACYNRYAVRTIVNCAKHLQHDHKPLLQNSLELC